MGTLSLNGLKTIDVRVLAKALNLAIHELLAQCEHDKDHMQFWAVLHENLCKDCGTDTTEFACDCTNDE